MAGYRREPTTVKLRFEDPEMAGLVVRMRSLSIGAYLELAELAGGVEGTPASVGEQLQMVHKLFAAFASSLLEWNLEEDGPTGTYPVPPTLEGVKSQDLPFVLLILQEWMGAMAGPDRPLPAGSPSGGPSPELSIPMEPLSASRPS